MKKGIISVLSIAAVIIIAVSCSSENSPLSETLFESDFLCGDSVTFTYSGAQVTYGTVESGNGRCWLDRNLGASLVATSSTDQQAYGDLFQWGRGDDGHQSRNSRLTRNSSGTDQPGHGDFYVTFRSPFDWREPQNDNLWQGVNGINNPCPDGFRLPTGLEWDDERLSWNSLNANNAFDSPLKLPLPGWREYEDDFEAGDIFEIGLRGDYWSSTVGDTGAITFSIGNDFASFHRLNRAFGHSVRCIKD